MRVHDVGLGAAAGSQRSEFERVGPERSREFSRESVVREIDVGHRRQQCDRSGDGADEAVLLQGAANGSRTTQVGMMFVGIAYGTRRYPTAAPGRKGRVHFYETREVADDVDRPAEFVCGHVAAAHHKRTPSVQKNKIAGRTRTVHVLSVASTTTPLPHIER